MTADDFSRPESCFGMTRCWTIWASLVLLLPAWQIEAAASREVHIAANRDHGFQRIVNADSSGT
jgi:hypothetical protein